MRSISSAFLFVTSILGIASCAPGAASPSSTGVWGGAITSTITVHVVQEASGEPVVAAMVDVGGTPVTTDAHGDATVPASGSVTLHVRAPGLVSERWIGVDRDHATVALAPPRPAQPYSAHVEVAGGADLVVSFATTVSMLRVTPLVGTTSPCAAGVCDVSVEIAPPSSAVDGILRSASDARLAAFTLGDASLLFDPASVSASVPLVTLDVTIPTAPGLEGVVGVPGISSPRGVALIPALDGSAVAVGAPDTTGPFAGTRLWYVARATNADGSGESVLVDRDIGADHHVRLASSFLAIPSATASGSVGIDVDPEVELYVVEAYAGLEIERTLVLHPSGSHLDVPITLTAASGIVVRAVDTTIGTDGVDLDEADRLTTRFATLSL
jgi:hypothetical protein